MSGGVLSVRALKRLRSCSQSISFGGLGEIPSRARFLYGLKDEIVSTLMMKLTEQEAREKLFSYIDEAFPEEEGPVSRSSVMRTDRERVARLLSFYYREGYECVDAGVGYSYHTPKTTCHGVEVEEIRDHADLIVKKGDTIYAVNLTTGDIPYSYKARKTENKVCYALELILAYLGLSKKYPGIEVALWSLKSKEDKGSVVAASYDDGKAFIKWHFNNEADALQMYQGAIALVHEDGEDCASCRCSSLCHIPKVTAVEQDAAIVKTAAPVFTEAQETVVKHQNGPMAVLAVPGSGKTFALVQRLLCMIREKDVAPGKIMFVTFTKKAANEIVTRVSAEIPESGGMPDVFTFNALGFTILKENEEIVGARSKIACKTDRWQMIHDCLQMVPEIKQVSYAGMNGEFGLLSSMDTAIAEINESGIDEYRLHHPDKDCEGIYRLYLKYREIYQREGYISYDEQVILAEKLLREHPEILAKYQDRWEFVMCDEFQDVSKEQMSLVYLLAGRDKNIVVVGDDDQSIYEWRGGTNEYLLQFKRDWPDAKMVVMNQNFRSLSTITEAANALIENNLLRHRKKIVAGNKGAYQPLYLRNFDNSKLWGYIGTAIKKGYKPGEIAIIARTNKQLISIQKELRGYVECVSPKIAVIDDAVFLRLFETLEIYALVAEGQMSDYHLVRWLLLYGVEKEGLGHMGAGFYERCIAEGKLLPFDLSDLDLLDKYRDMSEKSRLMEAGFVLMRALKEIQYAAVMEESLDKLCRILFGAESHPVMDVMKEKCREQDLQNMAQLHRYMKVMVDYHDDTEVEYPVREDAVNLLTAHKSKGKEFPFVFVADMESYDDSERGRSLLYVAMTRAKRTLVLAQGIYKQAPLACEIMDYVIVR